jgi:hypothetical protein
MTHRRIHRPREATCDVVELVEVSRDVMQRGGRLVAERTIGRRGRL